MPKVSESKKKTVTSKTAAKPKTMPNKKLLTTSKNEYYMTGMLFILTAVLFGVFIYFNAIGVVGGAIKSFFMGLFGVSAYLLPIILLSIGIYVFIKKELRTLVLKSCLLAISLLFTASLFSQFASSTPIESIWNFYGLGIDKIGGGLVGGAIYTALSKLIGNVATMIVQIVIIVVTLSLATHFSLFKFSAGMFKGFKENKDDMKINYETSYEAGKNIGKTISLKTARKHKIVDIPMNDDPVQPAKPSEPVIDDERKTNATFQKLKNKDDELRSYIENIPVFGIGTQKKKEDSPEPYSGGTQPIEEDEILNVSFHPPAQNSEHSTIPNPKNAVPTSNNVIDLQFKSAEDLADELIKKSSMDSLIRQSEKSSVPTLSNHSGIKNCSAPNCAVENFGEQKFEITSVSDTETDPITKEEIFSNIPLAPILKPLSTADKLGYPPAPGISPTVKSTPLSYDEFQKELEAESGMPPKPIILPYTYPTVSLLELPKVVSTTNYEEEIRQNVVKLVDTLKSFGVTVTPLQASRGPSVTRYELQPGLGVKVSKITGLSDDIALNLAATAVRIEAPIPGKAAIGIEIPNKNVSIVSLREVIDSPEFSSSQSKLSVALGKDIAGNPVVGDISKMPHVLIAGATGSGKSVCINTLITSLIYKSDPNEVKFIMIDPKVVELGIYNGIPHLLVPVVTDPTKAAGSLNWAVQEMVRRYGMFAENNVRDLKGYNNLIGEKFGKEYKMPNIVIIIDELADLMMVAPNDVEDSICRLAQMARAAGMHLVIATQRPSVDVITGIIKANIPSRIAFAVSSQVDSRTILDMAGAEKLLGKGDMLYYPTGSSKPRRIQGAFVSDKEIETIVEHIKGSSAPCYDEDIVETMDNVILGGKKGKSKKNDPEEDSDIDELLNDSIQIAVDMGQISTSFIQRRLKVGYARAGRIIDQMEERSIISGFDGSKPRTVLITKEQWYNMNN